MATGCPSAPVAARCATVADSHGVEWNIVSGVQLKNDKGVIITLQGPRGGLEVSANITKVVITLDPSRSTPD